MKVVVYTAICGNYDLLQPPLISNPNVDYLCFTDQEQLHIPDPWEKVPLPDRKDVPPRLKARTVKLLPHLFLEDKYDFSIWIDGNTKLITDPEKLCDDIPGTADIAMFEHPRRNCVYEEIEACRAQRKDTRSALHAVEKMLREEGFPEQHGLWASYMVIRRNASGWELWSFCELWMGYLLRWTIRDQIALPLALRDTTADLHTLPKRLEPEVLRRTIHKMPKPLQ